MYPLDYKEIVQLTDEVIIVELHNGSFKQFNIYHKNNGVILCDDFETCIELN